MAEEIPTILNHVSVAITDVDRSLAFYDRVLGVIGAKRVMEHQGAVAYGKIFPEFWVHHEPFDGGAAQVANGVHFSFHAVSEEQVRAFYDAALAAGGTDEGAPGPRPEYAAPYYGCFVRDPDGHKLEVTFWDESKV